MNLAVGFACPTCRRQEANLLAIEKDLNANPVSFRLYCTRCETVFRAMRESPTGQTTSATMAAEGR
jgi:uncharacterized protein YbaR (Trm112 family)